MSANRYIIHWIPALALTMLAAILSTACQQARVTTDTLSSAQGSAIVEAATQALQRARSSNDNNWDGVSIAPRFWGPEIAQLHPIRVWEDAGNVVIVLRDDGRVHEGWYVVPAISSSLPRDGAETKFEPMMADTKGNLYTVPLSSTSQNGELTLQTSTLYRYHSTDRLWTPHRADGSPI